MQSIGEIFTKSPANELFTSPETAFKNFDYTTHFMFYFLLIMTGLLILLLIWGYIKDRTESKIYEAELEAKKI